MKTKNWFVKLLSWIEVTLGISSEDTWENDVSVEDFLRGMKNITRMRKRIGKIMSGLDGRLRATKLFAGSPGAHNDAGGVVFKYLGAEMCRAIPTESGYWAFSWSAKTGYCLGFYLWGKDGSLSPRPLYLCILGDSDTDNISFEHVQAVYESLQPLLDDLLEHFPALREDFEVAAAAADALD